MWAATFHAQNTGQLLPPAGRIDSFRRWAGLCRFLPPNTRTQMLPNAYSYQQKQCWKKQHLDLHCLQETGGKTAISRSIRDWFERSMCTNQAHVLLFFFFHCFLCWCKLTTQANQISNMISTAPQGTSKIVWVKVKWLEAVFAQLSCPVKASRAVCLTSTQPNHGAGKYSMGLRPVPF